MHSNIQASKLSKNPDNSIKVQQRSFAKSITKIIIPEQNSKETLLDTSTTKMFQAAVGKLNWLATISRPDISFDVSYLSACLPEATFGDVAFTNKLISKVQSEAISIHYPALDKQSLHIQVYTDGSFNSLPNNGSQGGPGVSL